MFKVFQPSVLTSLILMCSTLCYTQAPAVSSQKNFFASQDSSIRSWLEYHNLSPVISLNEIQVKKKSVVAVFSIPDLYNWQRLQDTMRAQQSTPLPRLLFFKLLFLTEVGREQLYIRLEGNDGIVRIRWNGQSLDVVEEKKQGPIIDKINVPIGQLNDISFQGSLTANKNHGKIKRKLAKGLEDYFRQYKSYFEDYKFEIFEPSENEVVLEVRNVTNVVLDEGYFEKIQIQLNFLTTDNSLEIQYLFQAKYGAGLIWAPYDSRFKDMDPKYEAQLKKFNYKLKSKINQILTN